MTHSELKDLISKVINEVVDDSQKKKERLEKFNIILSPTNKQKERI